MRQQVVVVEGGIEARREPQHIHPLAVSRRTIVGEGGQARSPADINDNQRWGIGRWTPRRTMVALPWRL
jgi:hypothetical protein